MVSPFTMDLARSWSFFRRLLEMLDSADNRGRSAWSASSPMVWMSHMASFQVDEGPTPWMW